MSEHDLTAFLSPESSFEDLDAWLTASGWAREPDRAGDNAGRPEPVFVSWSFPESDDEIDYTWEPETGLRLLEIRGLDAERWRAGLAAALPVLSVEDVRGLLRASDPARARLGLRIAGALRDGRLADDVIALTRSHPDRAVRSAAVDVMRQALRELAPQADPGDPAALFAATPDPRYRRQILRRLLSRHPEANDRILAAVAAGLRDPDWEVRATAMLATGRWRAASLLPQVRACDLKRRHGLGPTRFDAGIIEAAQQIVVHILLGGPPVTAPPGGTTVDRFREYLYYSILDVPDERYGRIFLYIQALTTPLESDFPEPAALPPGILLTQGGYLLEAAGLPLRWIPPVPCWLGDDIQGLTVPNPIRRHRPERGFFLAEDLSGEGGEPWVYTWEEARDLCDQLAHRTGLPLRLPTADEWEMAARGTDGRLFPWGNGIEPGGREVPSPWGCRHMMGVVAGEWTETATEAGIVVCGASRHGCGARAALDPVTKRAGFRIAVPAPLE